MRIFSIFSSFLKFFFLSSLHSNLKTKWKLLVSVLSYLYSVSTPKARLRVDPKVLNLAREQLLALQPYEKIMSVKSLLFDPKHDQKNCFLCPEFVQEAIFTRAGLRVYMKHELEIREVTLNCSVF